MKRIPIFALLISSLSTMALVSNSEAAQKTRARKSARASSKKIVASAAPLSSTSNSLTPAPVLDSVETTQAAAVTNTSTASQDLSSTSVTGRSFGGDFTSALSTSAYEPESANSSQSWDMELAPWINVGSKFRLDAVVAFSKDLSQERKSAFKNAVVGFGQIPVALGQDWKYRAKVSTTLPTEKEKNDVTSFRTALALQQRFYFSPNGGRNFNSYYQLSVARNFYQYATTGDGESNAAWRVSNRILLDYAFNDRWSVSVAPSIYTDWTLEGTPMTGFLHGEEIAYTISARWALAIGHENGADFYKENGRDSNFSILDRDSSKFYASFTHRF